MCPQQEGFQARYGWSVRNAKSRAHSALPRKEAWMNQANVKSGSVEAYTRNSIDACANTVRQWTHGFQPYAEILQFGFAGGTIPQLLIDADLCLHLVEASRTRLDIFRQMFPEVPSGCSESAGCDLFSRTFDGVLLCSFTPTKPEVTRVAQLARIEPLLRAGGRLLIIIHPENQAPIDVRGESEATCFAKNSCEGILRNLGLDTLPRLLDRSGNEYISAIKHVYPGVPN